MIKRLAAPQKSRSLRLIAVEFSAPEALSAASFTLGLILFEWLTLTVPYGQYFVNPQQAGYVIVFGAFFGILTTFIWTALYFYASFTSTYRARVFYFAIFAAAVFFEYGYQNAYGRFSSVTDLRTALFEASFEQWRGSIRTYINWLALVPCVAYAALLLILKARRRSSWATLPVLLLIAAGFYAAISPYTGGVFSTLSPNAFLRTLVITPLKSAGGYDGPRDEIPMYVEARPENNIILIVDESVRGDHLSVNGYARRTTPHLEELLRQGWLRTWGVAAAGSTCSKDSNDLLLTGMGPSDLPDENYQIRKRPSLFQYAKAMGYRTHYFDGQRESFWLGTSHDLKYIDEWRPASKLSTDAIERDPFIGKKVSEIVGGSAGNFIWINKRGVHYPYADKYPPPATRGLIRLDAKSLSTVTITRSCTISKSSSAPSTWRAGVKMFLSFTRPTTDRL